MDGKKKCVDGMGHDYVPEDPTPDTPRVRQATCRNCGDVITVFNNS